MTIYLSACLPVCICVSRSLRMCVRACLPVYLSVLIPVLTLLFVVNTPTSSLAIEVRWRYSSMQQRPRHRHGTSSETEGGRGLACLRPNCQDRQAGTLAHADREGETHLQTGRLHKPTHWPLEALFNLAETARLFIGQRTNTHKELRDAPSCSREGPSPAEPPVRRAPRPPWLGPERSRAPP